MPVVSCTVAAMGMGSISFRSQFKTFEITAKSCLTIVLLVGTAAVPRGGCIRNMLRGRLLCAFGIGIALSLRASSTLFLQTGVMLFLLHKADQPLAFVLSQGRLLFLTEVKWQGGFPSCEVAVHWSLLALVEAPCWKVLRRHGFHGHKWQIEAGYFLGAVTAADHKLTMYNTPPRLAHCWLTSFDTHNQLIFPTLAVCHPRMSLYKVSAKRPNSIFGVEDQRSARVREDGHKPAAGRARTKMRMRTLTLMLSPKAAMVCFPASCSFAHVSVRTRKAFHGCNQTTRHTLHAPTLDAAQPPQLLRQVVALGKQRERIKHGHKLAIFFCQRSLAPTSRTMSSCQILLPYTDSYPFKVIFSVPLMSVSKNDTSGGHGRGLGNLKATLHDDLWKATK